MNIRVRIEFAGRVKYFPGAFYRYREPEDIECREVPMSKGRTKESMTLDSVSDHPKLRAAVRDRYRHIYAGALAIVHKRCSGLNLSAKEQMAENVVQEALLRAWTHADKYDTSRSAVAWLMGFVVKVVQEQARNPHHRRQVRQTDLGEEAWEQAMAGLVDGHRPGAGDDLAVLHRARQELTEPERRILSLHFDEHLDGEELAERLGLPSSGAARTAKCRALQALRTHFQILRRAEEGK